MAEADVLEGLSPSIVTALRFAHASAAQNQPSGPPEIDALDLVFGMMLAHPGSSPAERLMKHFQFSLANIKQDGQLTAGGDDLNKVLQAIDRNWRPQFETEAESAIDYARKNRGNDNIVHLSHLWRGVLAAPTGPFINRLTSELSRRGTTLSSVLSLTERWMSDPSTWEEPQYTKLLEENLPYRPGPVAVAKYNHDANGGAISGDLLQMSAEVDAFAYLLASVHLRPPLAVGLFGDWGSGKTFFMNSVQNRVDEIMVDPAVKNVQQNEAVFWRHVVQIDFNAWHYSETDLLASLVNHLLTELDRKTAEQAGEPTEDETSWIEALTAASKAEQKALEDIEAHEADLAKAKTKLAEAEEAARQKIQDAEAEAFEEVMDDAKQAIRDSVGTTALGVTTVAGVLAELQRARGELSRTNRFREALFSSRWRTAIVALFALAIPLVVVLVGSAQSATEGALAGLYTMVGEAGLALAAGNRWLAARNDKLDQVITAAEAAVADARAEAKAVVDPQHEAVAALQSQLSVDRQRLAEAEHERRDVESKMREPTSQVIQRFIRERIEAGTYRDRLGLHALVREDLDRLSRYIAKQNDELLAGTTTDTNPRMFNRIILYIDDLDRCPDKKVIEVLQAVHLLLAFDLFVVVVAVDDRWLSHALESHYPVLAQHRNSQSGSPGGHPVHGGGVDLLGPSDYLEKIFQVPFRVRPIGPEGRRLMIDGLLRDQVERDGVATRSSQTPEGVRLVTGREEDVMREMAQTPIPSVRAAAQELTLSGDEFDMLSHLAPLLGDTPRAVKRFTNVYQLLKMMLGSAGPQEPPDYQIAACLLGLDEGSPEVATKLRRLGTDSLGSVDELRGLTQGLPIWARVTADRIDKVDEAVKRFQFPPHIPPQLRTPS